MWSNELDKSPRYKIWAVHVYWTYMTEDGRMNNHASIDHMPKDPEESTYEKVEAWAQSWWQRVLENGQKEKPEYYKDVQDVRIEIKLDHEESWCGTWFTHWTWDVGQTDQEALNSFQAYVDRVQVYNEKWRWENNIHDQDLDKICLMGAEDRWRWRSLETDHNGDSKPAPCRCEKCKEHGVIRILH